MLVVPISSIYRYFSARRTERHSHRWFLCSGHSQVYVFLILTLSQFCVKAYAQAEVELSETSRNSFFGDLKSITAALFGSCLFSIWFVRITAA